MGRPIKARYFLRSGPKVPADAIKGSGVTVSVNANGTGYSTGATAAISAPNVSGGVNATLSLTITPAGGITAATVGNEGSGYTSAPTVTVTPAATQTATGRIDFNSLTITNLSGVAGVYPGMLISEVGGMAPFTHVVSVGTNTVVMDKVATNTVTSSVFTFADTGTSATFNVGLTFPPLDTNTIATTAYLSTGSSGVASAIIKQEASRRYLVENAQGRGQCHLTSTDVLSAGQMKIIATDFSGATYYVTKLTAHKATLVNRTSTSTALVTKESTGWTIGSATGTIVTISHN